MKSMQSLLSFDRTERRVYVMTLLCPLHSHTCGMFDRSICLLCDASKQIALQFPDSQLCDSAAAVGALTDALKVLDASITYTVIQRHFFILADTSYSEC